LYVFDISYNDKNTGWTTNESDFILVSSVELFLISTCIQFSVIFRRTNKGVGYSEFV